MDSATSSNYLIGIIGSIQAERRIRKYEKRTINKKEKAPKFL